MKLQRWTVRADKESALVITDNGDMAADFTRSGRNHKQDVANATLAAAAPELYAALDSLLGRINECDAAEEIDYGDTSYTDTARAALAKARGES